MRIVLLLLLSILSLPVVLRADKPASPCSYIKHSPDRRFAFVMLAPDAEHNCLSQGAAQAEQSKQLREKYKVSGMFENADPARLKWTPDEPWFTFDVLVANDGESIVRDGPWARELSDEAFSFIRNGKVVRTVRIDELIDEADVERTASHFFWKASSGLTSDTKGYYVTTLAADTFRFDVKTGETVHSTRAAHPVANGSPAADQKPSATCLALFIALFALAISARRARP